MILWRGRINPFYITLGPIRELNKPPVIYDSAPAAYPQAMLKSPA